MLTAGDLVPDFELPNQDGTLVRLSDLRGQRVVIFTFPQAGTAGCTAQACDLRDAAPRLSASNTVVLGVSVDSQADLKAWQQAQNLCYDLLSDPDHRVIDTLGGFRMSLLGVTIPLLRNRTLWIIDEDGRVFESHVPVSPLGSAAKALSALERMPTRIPITQN